MLVSTSGVAVISKADGVVEYVDGKKIVVKTAKDKDTYIKSIKFEEKTYILNPESKVKCYTSIDFVEKTEHIGVFDMELYTLASLFPNIKSVKIVSDNLNFKDWKQVDIKDAWKEANNILFGAISGNK